MSFKLPSGWLNKPAKAACRPEHQAFETLFDQASQAYGNHVKAVGWFSRETQEIRFEILSQIADLHGSSVLDVGCGLGDLLHYFQKREIHCQYTGIDLSRNMIRLACQNHPAQDFRQLDVLDPQFTEQFDFCLSSGAFNYRLDKPYAYLKHMLHALFAKARFGAAINMLSSYTPVFDQDLEAFTYYQPEQVLAMCLEITPRVVIHHHYLPNDFTVMLYRVSAHD